MQTIGELLDAAAQDGLTLGRVARRWQAEHSEQTEADVNEEMRRRLCVMRESAQAGLSPNLRSVSGMVGGQAAKLIGLYVSPNYRRLGMAKCLIAAGMKTLSERGVNHVECDVIRRNEMQRLLARSCSATFVRTACYYPGINYD